jgi:hypothetical protein
VLSADADHEASGRAWCTPCSSICISIFARRDRALFFAAHVAAVATRSKGQVDHRRSSHAWAAFARGRAPASHGATKARWHPDALKHSCGGVQASSDNKAFQTASDASQWIDSRSAKQHIGHTPVLSEPSALSEPARWATGVDHEGRGSRLRPLLPGRVCSPRWRCRFASGSIDRSGTQWCAGRGPHLAMVAGGRRP